MRLTILGSVTICAMFLFLAPTVAARAEEKKSSEFPKDWFWKQGDHQGQREAMAGSPMPAWNVSSWINGEKKPEDLKGKIVVIDFWATWCSPCLVAIPHVNEIKEKYKDQGVEVVGICCSDGAESMESTAKERGIKYSTAKDVDKTTAKAFNVDFWPTFVLIDREGEVRGVGFQTDHIEDALKMVLAEQPAKTDDAKPISDK